MATTIEIEDSITVGTLAEQLKLPVTKVIGELFKNGIMATVNERIDIDTAQIIVEELGLEVELVRKETVEVAPREKKTASETAISRAPVVAVMGHVDHGKTSLLDAIRGAQVAKGEAGGITQHISAYQILRNDRPITFLDTPGHEAFAAIREHGAHLTDLAIIVVAADDGVKPQTIEAIRFARKAGTKIIVAINKIDKEGADVNRVKQELAEQELLPEEWGGDTVMVELSAKTKQGVDNLLDMILLVADVEDFRADIDVPGSGLIIEAHIEQGRGPVAHALIEEGVLRPGMFIVSGSTYAKIRNLEGSGGKALNEAVPSMPVAITGFKTLPEFGDPFVVANNEREARSRAEQASLAKRTTTSNSGMNSNELMRLINRTNKLEELNIVIKADVQGSLTSVIDAIKTLDTDEVAVRIVSSGVGVITEGDVYLAHSSGAVIYGFNVDMPANIRRIAGRDKVSIRLYKVIYELIDDVKSELSGMLAPETVETEQGRLVVRGVFKTTKTDIICGGEVTKGRLIVPAFARVIRDNETLGEAELVRLQRGPQEAKEVLEGEMCGVSLKTTVKLDLQDGDRLEVFTRDIITRQLM
ncbi:MAG: translation initiation factor IF-2 [Candidatus Saccharimonadales bacterium]